MDCDKCQHTTVINNECSYCGIIILTSVIPDDEYIKHNRRRVKPKKYDKDFANFTEDDIPMEVRNYVNYLDENSNTEVDYVARSRKIILFSYLRFAFKNLRIDYELEHLASLLKLTKSNITESDKLISGTSRFKLPLPIENEISVHTDLISPVVYIRSTLVVLEDALNIKLVDMYLTPLNEFIHKIYAENKCLRIESAKILCISLIKYYLLKQKIIIPKYHTYFNATPASIKKYMTFMENLEK